MFGMWEEELEEEKGDELEEPVAVVVCAGEECVGEMTASELDVVPYGSGVGCRVWFCRTGMEAEDRGRLEVDIDVGFVEKSSWYGNRVSLKIK